MTLTESTHWKTKARGALVAGDIDRGLEEIARALGKPAGATRHCVFRAVQKLREALAPMVSAAAAGREAET